MKEHPHYPQFIENERAMSDDVDYIPNSREITRAYIHGEISEELFRRSVERSTEIFQENLGVRPIEQRTPKKDKGLKKIFRTIFG